MGIVFPRCQAATTGLWDFLSSMLLKPWKESGVAEGLLRREGTYFLGGTCMWGMRDYRMVSKVGT